MGCEAQVHEKINKRVTWAYHSVDEWYLFTSPEHYRTQGRQRIQLVGGLLIEPLIRGSHPSGAGVFLRG